MKPLHPEIEKKFLSAVLTSNDGIQWRATDNSDISHCLSMADILKGLFEPMKHKNRLMTFVPLDIVCPPMVPVAVSDEKQLAVLSKWRFCIKCHKKIGKYGRLVLLFVRIKKGKGYMAWEPMLVCTSCSWDYSEKCYYFPWIISIRTLWDNPIYTALNVCYVCLLPIEGDVVCGQKCVKFIQDLEKLKSGKEEKTKKAISTDLIDIIVERMANANVSIYEPVLCSQCTVVKNCFKKAKGKCERCGKIAYCAFHVKEGEKHVEEEKCDHFSDVWDSKNFVVL